jgi:hypothetical protein
MLIQVHGLCCIFLGNGDELGKKKKNVLRIDINVYKMHTFKNKKYIILLKSIKVI